MVRLPSSSPVHLLSRPPSLSSQQAGLVRGRGVPAERHEPPQVQNGYVYIVRCTNAGMLTLWVFIKGVTVSLSLLVVLSEAGVENGRARQFPG